MNIAMLIAGLACSHTTIQRFFVYDVDQKFKMHLWTLNSWTDDYILLTFPFTDHYMDILPPTHFSVSFILILIFLLEVQHTIFVFTFMMRTRLEISLNSMIMPKILVPAEAHTHTIGKTERTWKEDVKKWLQERHLDLDKHLKHWLLGHSAYM